MPAPYPDQQKAARRRLADAFASAITTRVIHYSCESFDDRPQGRSPRITSIAVRRLDSSDTESFSIHRIAERHGLSFEEIEEHYDSLERGMLDEFFSYVQRSDDITYLHWNMRDANYGFAAIEQRYAVLGGAPTHISEHRRIDLSPLIQQIYGTDYIEHPRFYSLAEKNGITLLRGLNGGEEAAAFQRKDYVALHQSTLRKVDILQTFAERTHRRTLKTDANWWTINGGNVRGLLTWTAENKLLSLAIALAALILGVLTAHFGATPTQP